MASELKEIDRAALYAFVAAAAEELEGDILLVARDGTGVRIGASEGAGLNAQVILSQCLRGLNQLEAQALDPTMHALVRIASEDLNNDQLLLIVRDQSDIRLAYGSGARGKVGDILNDALQSVGGERRRR
jgi:hypothetical protein